VASQPAALRAAVYSGGKPPPPRRVVCGPILAQTSPRQSTQARILHSLKRRKVPRLQAISIERRRVSVAPAGSTEPKVAVGLALRAPADMKRLGLPEVLRGHAMGRLARDTRASCGTEMKSSLTPLSSLISTSARSASAFTTMPIVTVGQRPSRRTRRRPGSRVGRQRSSSICRPRCQSCWVAAPLIHRDDRLTGSDDPSRAGSVG
jgi:hypothetical protein